MKTKEYLFGLKQKLGTWLAKDYLLELVERSINDTQRAAGLKQALDREEHKYQQLEKRYDALSENFDRLHEKYMDQKKSPLSEATIETLLSELKSRRAYVRDRSSWPVADAKKCGKRLVALNKAITELKSLL